MPDVNLDTRFMYACLYLFLNPRRFRVWRMPLGLGLGEGLRSLRQES